jgi:hypothetical protein
LTGAGRHGRSLPWPYKRLAAAGNAGGEGGAWIVEAARCGYMGCVMVEGLH